MGPALIDFPLMVIALMGQRLLFMGSLRTQKIAKNKCCLSRHSRNFYCTYFVSYRCIYNSPPTYYDKYEIEDI